jgi:Protein of unknown function (DUF3040)
VQPDGQRSGQRHTKGNHHQRAGTGTRRWRCSCRGATRSPRFCQQRELNRIEQALVAEDPGLGSRFAIFTRLTRHEAMPGTGLLPHRLQRFVRRAIIPPLMVISLVALLAASWLISSQQVCPAGPDRAAHNMSSVSRAPRCQPSPSVELDRMPAH